MPARHGRGRPPHPDVLTPTEWRVLTWVRHGLRRRGIAERLGTSDNAVKYHLANISAKLGVRGLRGLRHWPGYPAIGPRPGRNRMSTSPRETIGRVGPIGQVSLLATDIGRVEAFYRDALGLPHLFTFGDLAFFDCDGVRIFLRAVPPDEWRPSSILYFRVDDIDARFRELVDAGATPQGQPHVIHRHADSGVEEWMAFFDDSEGNTLALMSRVTSDEAPIGQAGR